MPTSLGFLACENFSSTNKPLPRGIFFLPPQGRGLAACISSASPVSCLGYHCSGININPFAKEWFLKKLFSSCRLREGRSATCIWRIVDQPSQAFRDAKEDGLSTTERSRCGRFTPLSLLVPQVWQDRKGRLQFV